MTVTVTAVTTNLAVDDRRPLSISDMPVLTLEVSPSGGEGIETFDFNFSTAGAVLFLEHLLLIRSAGVGEPGVAPRLVFTLIDNYISEIKSDPDLNSNLSQPLQVVGIRAGMLPFMGGVYFGLVFRHRWVFEI